MGIKVRLKGEQALRDLAKRLNEPDRLLAKAAEVGAEETLNLISDGFADGMSPYGDFWDAPNDLQITGRLRSYAKSAANARGWKVHSTDQKAAWHHNPQPRPQWGGKALKKRLQVPVQSQGMPLLWARRLKLALEEAIAGLLKRYG